MGETVPEPSDSTHPELTGQHKTRDVDDARQIFELRLTGMSMHDVADQLGISPAGCYRLHDYWINQLVKPSAEAAREVEVARLDRYLLALEPGIKTGDVKSVAEARAISARRSELLGLNIPTTKTIRVQAHSEVDESLAKLVEEHKSRAHARR